MGCILRFSLYRMVNGVKNVIFVVGNIGSGLVGTNRHAMMMSLRKLSAQSNVVNTCTGRTEIRWKIQRQMMNRRKLNRSMGIEKILS